MRRRSKPVWSVLDWRGTRTWAPGMHWASWSEEGVRVRRETATPGAAGAVAARARWWWPWLVWAGAARAVALVVAARAAAANRVRVLRCMRNGLRSGWGCRSQGRRGGRVVPLCADTHGPHGPGRRSGRAAARALRPAAVRRAARARDAAQAGGDQVALAAVPVGGGRGGGGGGGARHGRHSRLGRVVRRWGSPASRGSGPLQRGWGMAPPRLGGEPLPGSPVPTAGATRTHRRAGAPGGR